MANLSQRMEALATLVSPGATLADVGCDHGYLSIALVERGVVASAIAMDVRPGPLATARRNVEAAGLEESIELRLSDGLEKLGAGEASTILIAGMGGSLMQRILSAKPKVVKAASELILQPQSELPEFREFIVESGLAIVEEDMVLEDGKFYPMMRVVKPVEPSVEAVEPSAYSQLQLTFGPHLLAQRHPVLQQYLLREQRLQLEIKAQLEAQISQSDGAQERLLQRLAEVQAYLQLIAEGLAIFADEA